ncbi:hypothetical protein NP233_g605 [Leucocoprinus birnbaumii]|uniref:glutamine--tRNA ligase n=1 Tax=Leucocoprinus birnbaumii TaxID=56174 RepID=A0AAD5W3U6_9AGAR|nr:hypothetical protein NP233_g605 [Leucocoprinus birnbaumii]
MDETFVNVWLDHDEPVEDQSKKDFYKSWIHYASAKHSDPGLTGAHRLRKLYPKHAIVSTQAYDLQILGFPGLTATPLSTSPLITDVIFQSLPRSAGGPPGLLVDQVRVGAFEVVWKGYEFLVYIGSYPATYGGTITQYYVLHEGPEERARLLLKTVGAWAHELNNEIWVFNQGFWQKGSVLWQEIQKANWDDVILKESFKKSLQKDIYGFFSAQEIYKKLSIPWKRGLIMYGPPGNGKTISVKAIMKSCNENGFVPLYVKSFQSYKGEEGAIQDVFQQARQVSPACLILEDLDSLINDRNRSFFLNQLDGLDSNNGLLIIGTTNHFDRLDPGLSSRPSRFDRKYLFDDPDAEERALYAKYWQKKLSDNPELEFPDSLVESVAKMTSGFSFAYLKEAFVSTLVTLAGIPGDKPNFGDLLKNQIHDLRKQLDDQKPGNDATTTRYFDNTQASVELQVPKDSRDIRILLDALNDRVAQQSPQEKIYSMFHPTEPSDQLDPDARRVRILLDSLSDSVSQMDLSSPTYRKYVTRDDLPVSQDGIGGRVYQRRLPTPPGPPGMPWDGVSSAHPTPGSFVHPQPMQIRSMTPKQSSFLPTYLSSLPVDLATKYMSKIRPENEALVSLFQSIGLTQAKALEAAKSPKPAAILKDIVEQHDLVSKKPGEKEAGLLVGLASALNKAQNATNVERDYVLRRILNGDLKTIDQVNAAVKYMDANKSPVNDQEFDDACGVGFVITSDDILAQAKDYVTSTAVAGWANLGATLGSLRNSPRLRWANPLDVKNAVERVFLETFGPKESAKPKAKEPKKEPKKQEKQEIPAADAAATRKAVFEEGFLGSLHKPGENPQIHPHLKEQHLAATKGAVWTRFPPEPNGYLHIGHSKAIFVNFGYAAHNGGKCYLRYDDTNPEKEEARYFESILEMVRWLGFEPWKITYSSDYFDELYQLAVELIKRDKAYVCHCTQEEIKADRGEKKAKPRACVHRGRPIEESLAEFENMKNGKYKPKEAALRMKQDLEDGNPQMWDLTAYRVLETPHHRTHDKWKVYPTYDFTHCLVDSMENISHSLCTVEFVASRQSYDWLCDALEVYKPRQSEYGRLNLEGTIMSKRKILALVEEGFVSGWDDPRLYTLIALRRRGVPPGAIISFVSTLGVSTSTTSIEIARFEQAVRQYLEGTAPRLLMVLRPLKVTIENLSEDYVLIVEKLLHPKVPEFGTSKIPFSRTIYIDRDDFRLEDSKDYFRLAPGKTVGLFQAPYPITCTSYKTDPSTGEVTELICKLENEGPRKKPQAFIQWVAEHAPSGSPVRIDEVRVFHRLFKSNRPDSDFRNDINPDSLEVIKGAMVETGFWSLAKQSFAEARKNAEERTKSALAENKDVNAAEDTPHVTSDQLVGNECIRFQGLRVAYFAVDKDSRIAAVNEAPNVEAKSGQGDYLILNQIVTLKEDSGKST